MDGDYCSLPGRRVRRQKHVATAGAAAAADAGAVAVAVGG